MTSELCRAVETDKHVNVSGAELKALLESFLRSGNACRIRANGSSMTPSIRDGDIITIEPITATVRSGDVVAASDMDGGRVLLHRVVKCRNRGDADEYLLQGDNGCAGEDWVGKDCILGKVLAVSREGRSVRLLGGLPGRVGGWLIRCICRLRRAKSSGRFLIVA